MAVEEKGPVAQAPGQNAYGKVFRERGTLKIVLAAVVLAVAWYTFNNIQTYLLNQKKWPPLQAEPKGLTVLGLRDKDRPGWRRKYIAIEANHAWQIRRPDDAAEDEETTQPGKPEDDTPEPEDRGGGPAAASRIARGSIVPVDEIMRTCPVVLNGRSFTDAWIEEKSDYSLMMERKYWVVHLELSPEGRSRYYQFSQHHEKERLVFVLDGLILTCPRMDALFTTSLSIEPIWVMADAKKLADYITQQKR